MMDIELQLSRLTYWLVLVVSFHWQVLGSDVEPNVVQPHSGS